MTIQDTTTVSSVSDRAAPSEARRDSEPVSNVLIASPDESLRATLRQSLHGFCKTHEAAHWETLDRTISSMQPEVVLFDMDLLTESAISDLSIIRRISRKTKIIVLSETTCDEEGLSALKAGARGYCGRALDAPALRRAISKVREGEIWAERRLIPILIEKYSNPQEKAEPARPRPDRRLALLTPREREIARLIGAGATNRDIASRLHVGEGTVKAHLTAIFRKLGFTDRLQLGLFLAGPAPRTRGRS